MPWSSTTPMDQKTKFIADYLRGSFSISELCTSFGISRKTGYKWIDCYLGVAVFACLCQDCLHKTLDVDLVFTADGDSSKREKRSKWALPFEHSKEALPRPALVVVVWVAPAGQEARSRNSRTASAMYFHDRSCARFEPFDRSSGFERGRRMPPPRRQHSTLFGQGRFSKL